MENPSDQSGGAAAPTREKKRAKKPDPLIGRTVGGRYVIDSKIGVGGMGVVYKAKQGAVDRDIAVKVLIPEKLSGGDDETLIRRFHLEARAASKLAHPNTITIYDFGQDDDGLLYIAMEFLDGLPLDKVLREGPMDPARVVSVILQACSSLAEAHKKGIIHRDIKPDNIFLIEVGGDQDFVKVLDFGVAKIRSGGGAKEKTLTQAGMIFGTPKYMSPEQARCLPLDARSDVYALGVMMYQMLMGDVPFDADDHVSVLLAHCSEPPTPFQEKAPDLAVPPELEAIVSKALMKDRDHRYQSTDEMAAALEAIATKLEWVPRTAILPKVSRGGGTPTPLPAPGLETPSPTASTLGGLSEPLMGRPSPEEAGLTPSGSVDWDGDLNLDLGVTPVARDEAERRGPSAGMIAGIAGGVALLVVLAVVGLVIATGGDDTPPEDNPEATNGLEEKVEVPAVPAVEPDASPDGAEADAGAEDPELAEKPEGNPEGGTPEDGAAADGKTPQDGTPTADGKAGNGAEEKAGDVAAKADKTNGKARADKTPPSTTKDKVRDPKPKDDKTPSVNSLLDSVKPKKDGGKKDPGKKPGKKPGSQFEDDPWAKD